MDILTLPFDIFGQHSLDFLMARAGRLRFFVLLICSASVLSSNFVAFSLIALNRGGSLSFVFFKRFSSLAGKTIKQIEQTFAQPGLPIRA